MERSDMMAVLRKFSNRYDKPSATESMIDDWLELFQRCDSKTIVEAANKVCLDCKFYPKTAELNKAYWEIYNEVKKAQKEQALANIDTSHCKYCGGYKWVRAIYVNKYGHEESEVFECICLAGDNVKLNKYLGSDYYKWSDKDKAFIPRGWVGDKEPVGQADMDFNNLSIGVKSL